MSYWGNCSAQYDAGQLVMLTASAAMGSTFTAWAGCSTSTQPSIQVTMSQLQTCTAGFTLTNYPLNIAISPSGGGTVSSFPGSVTCTSTNCSGAFGANQFVSVTAQAATGFRFGSWTGDCTNATQTSSSVTMTTTRACTANFIADVQLTVNKTGSTSTGTVTSSPAGISCGTECSGQSAGFAPGTDVTLTAAASTGATFCSASFPPSTQLRLLAAPNTGFTGATWGGDCTGTTGIDVTFSLTANRVCTVTFQ